MQPTELKGAFVFRSTVLALGVVMVTSAQSYARWKEQYLLTPSAIQDWYRAQQNANGERCCDLSDGHPYFGNYRLTHDGGVELELNDRPYRIPSYMVLNGPNPTGHAVWWYIDNEGGHFDFCFAKGSLN